MILNRLIFPQGNKLIFNIDHYENDRKYELAESEKYYVSISEAREPFSVLCTFQSDTSHFEAEAQLSYGEYVFEAGIESADNSRRIILPALDEQNRPLNQLIILRRLEECLKEKE